MELVDLVDSKSSALGRVGSNPTCGTTILAKPLLIANRGNSKTFLYTIYTDIEKNYIYFTQNFIISTHFYLRGLEKLNSCIFLVDSSTERHIRDLSTSLNSSHFLDFFRFVIFL